MLKAIQFALKYSHLVPVLLEFIQICVESGKDKQLTKKKRSALMKQYWVVVKAIQNS